MYSVLKAVRKSVLRTSAPPRKALAISAAYTSSCAGSTRPSTALTYCAARSVFR